VSSSSTGATTTRRSSGSRRSGASSCAATASFVPLAGISAYAALDAGKVLAADVFSTDPPLGKGSKYTVLKDPKHVTGFQNVAPIVKTSVAKAGGTAFANAVNKVSAKLTLPAIVAMNKAFYVDKKSAKSIATAFLKANGLI
jgi:osmoprotectant transport system substrate-binding protein